MELFLIIGVIGCYIIGWFCYLKISSYDIKKAEYAGTMKKMIYRKLVIEYICISLAIAGLMFLILSYWRAL